MALSALTKTFGRQVAVDGVTMSVARGEIFGFLGPNGAGKSTTIRMLLRLIRPSAGRARIFGRDVQAAPDVLKRIGSLVDGGAFYPFLSGRENLAVLARVQGGAAAARIDALLDQVGLGSAGAKRVKGYSTGMRQRLGVAAALLNDPELVILDEPANGLDAAGIGEMRALIRRLAREEGRTVFLSSHLLHEVEQVCDRVAIVDRGRVVHQSTMQALLERRDEVRIVAEPRAEAVALLAGAWTVAEVDDGLRVTAAQGEVPDIVARLVQGGVRVSHVAVERRTLEDAFLSLTGGEPA